MTAVDAVASWDPEAAISAAKELIHASNYAKVNEARETLDNTIAEWVRVASTDALVASDAALKARAVDAILKIWSLYAALEIELRQFKQATKVFESGASCPFAGPSAPFWLQYAEFCVERKKLSNARKVFVRALRAVPEADHGELWTRFHAFVVEHLDLNMTLASLQAQVFPDKDFSAVTDASKPVAESQPQTVNAVNAVQKEQPASAQRPEVPTVKAPVAAEPRAVAPVVAAPTTGPVSEDQPREQADVSPVDPSLAFVDKRGVEMPIVAAQAAGSKRKASDVATESPVKQAKVESPALGTVLATDEEIKSFLQLPTTLPVTPGCPHLLFDQMETQRAIDNELLERLSTILSDSAVFQGVKDLFDNQRQRDRDMLYRWQDLVGMQMKEGSELFARHAEAEKGVTESRELIELKNKHLEARREFVHRCQMSQQQFIEISELDRSGALKAQQISLENMKIPEMTVTTDANLIELQRAIIGLILEAEKLSREESAKKSEYYVRGKKPNFVPRGGPGYQRSDSRDRDRDSYPRGGGRGGRGGYSRGGGTFGRNSGGRRPFSPPRGGRGPPKRHDGYAAHSATAPRTYDAPPPRQTQLPAYQGNSHRNYAHGPSPGRGYGGEYQPRDRPAHFDRGQDRRPQTYGRGPPRELAVPPPHRYADAPPAHSGPPNDGRYDSQDTYRRPAPHAGGRGGRGAPPPARHVEYDRGDRYGAPQHAAPIAAAPVSRYGGEPPAPPQRYSAPAASYDYAPPASTPYAYQSQPPPQQQPPPQRVHYAQPSPVYQQPPPQQQQHYQPPPQQQQQLQQLRGYDAPPPSYQQSPPQHHVQQPAHHQPPPHHRPQHQTSPPRGGGRGGYDRFRRGGGGGGRYNRRY